MAHLPIDDVLPALRDALFRRDDVVLEAPPGAGKTTRVPLALLQEPWLAGQTILMLEPRRLAARAAAARLAAQLGEQPGETAGYRVRLDSRVGPSTRIEVVTEGILVRRLQDDPALDGVGLVIFDEFHERSLDADLALALVLSARQLLRDTPLKLLVMSATLEGERLATLLDQAPVIRSSGRLYPVSLHWGSPWQPGERPDSRVVACVLQALAQQSGSLLVFLPGQAEIRRVQTLLAEALAGRPEILLCPLHGELVLAGQQQAIDPAPPGQRKVVLATNIAETSLTIDGVQVVIDAGLARVPRFDPGSGMTRLETRRISRASATQRAGRAGRLGPGHCYRLWSEAQHAQLQAHGEPEILQADLAGLVLQLARWGMAPDELLWLDAPPAAACAQARELLVRLGALQPEGGLLTAHGQAMATLPLPPRLAHLLLVGQALGQVALAAQLAALLSERDLRRDCGADLALALQAPSSPQVRQLARQFRQLLPERGPADSGSVLADGDGPAVLLALAWPERIARQRRPGSPEYQLASGRAARLAEGDPLLRSPWLAVAELGSQQGQRDERIYRAAALSPARFADVLSGLVCTEERLEWDEREGVLRAECQQRLGQLVLERTPLAQVDSAARGQALLALVRRKGLELLPWTPELRQWQARVQLLRQLDLARLGQSAWPDLGDAALLAQLDDWLLPWLEPVSRLAHFARLDLPGILVSLLPWPLPGQLDALAPISLQVPSGSRVRLDYSSGVPVLAVRLQELFGLADTPRIAGGHQPVLLHLLSPARRPVQVTRDLASFWANTYDGVRKDLKGRYPRHYWPDDPLVAEPTARTRPRQSG